MKNNPSIDDRLEQIWTILINPKRQIRSIQALAAEHGFTDLSEFNSAFRRKYSTSPSDIRKAAKRGTRFGKPG